ncbi:MAG: hypothetical protein L0170_14035 [Acidobacteria bacterium]|nr:hypothetical protein [Acidobacteriota bacterium]
MELKSLDVLLSQYRDEALGAEGREIGRFLEFLLSHGGLKKLEVPGKSARLVDRADRLRCFHFSQFLDWYLTEKLGADHREVEDARLAMGHFNEWLLEQQAITHEAFEENRDSILSGESGPAVYEDVSNPELADEETGLATLREEKDFYVPGEYSATLSGEFILTQVQEGILYGKFPDGGKEIGPILVDRSVSSGHKVGDRVHLSLGRAGEHWNLLHEGQRRS